MMTKTIKLPATLFCLLISATSCGQKPQTSQAIPAAYAESVRAGRLTPSAAYALRDNAPLVDAMDAYVARMDRAQKRINQMPISETEKRKLIRAEMRKASAEWQAKFPQQTPRKMEEPAHVNDARAAYAKILQKEKELDRQGIQGVEKKRQMLEIRREAIREYNAAVDDKNK